MCHTLSKQRHLRTREQDGGVGEKTRMPFCQMNDFSSNVSQDQAWDLRTYSVRMYAKGCVNCKSLTLTLQIQEACCRMKSDRSLNTLSDRSDFILQLPSCLQKWQKKSRSNMGQI